MKKIYFNFIFLSLINILAANGQGSYTWLLDSGCNTASDCDADQVCYGLQYTSGFTGTLQSYTNFLFIDCVNDSDPTSVNESCVIVDNSENNDSGSCPTFGDAEVRISGQQGTFLVEQGMNYIIHEYCVSLSDGESTNILFDRTSLNGFLTDGTPFAEAPSAPATLTIDKDSDCFNILPVELVEFTVQQDKTHAVLNWITSTELNNDYFEIEYSADGVLFDPLAKVDGAGNASTLNSYTYVHENVGLGPYDAAYYRLRQVDFDGTAQHSPIRVIHFDHIDSSSPENMTFYPNPVSEELWIELPNQNNDSNVYLELMDIQGNLIKHIPSATLQIVNTSDLPNGIYVLRLLDQKRNVIQSNRVIKMKG